MKKFKQLCKYGAGAAIAVATTNASAALDTTAAVTEINAAQTSSTEIGIAVLGVVALIFAIRKAISLTSGR